MLSLVPSSSSGLPLRSKQREQWWSQPSHVHTCIKACESGVLLHYALASVGGAVVTLFSVLTR